MIPLPSLLRLVRRHQAGLLLDTNVLLLYVAIGVGGDFVRSWKRTREFTERHDAYLVAAVEATNRLVTTPHVLTETTNLVLSGATGAKTERAMEIIGGFAKQARENALASRSLSADRSFSRLGLADVALLTLATKLFAAPLLMTIDAPLTLELERRGAPVANLNHYIF